jgi:hypothetical protein
MFDKRYMDILYWAVVVVFISKDRRLKKNKRQMICKAKDCATRTPQGELEYDEEFAIPSLYLLQT